MSPRWLAEHEKLWNGNQRLKKKKQRVLWGGLVLSQTTVYITSNEKNST